MNKQRTRDFGNNILGQQILTTRLPHVAGTYTASCAKTRPF